MSELLTEIYDILSLSLLFGLALVLLWIICAFTIDIFQTSNTVRRNYPVIGRFRGLFEHLGTFFRQYFFAMDREEMPFNRAQRDWVYRAAKDEDKTIPFGSTRDRTPVGSISFVNCPFPTLEQDAANISPMTIGANCPSPYQAKSLFNISGMSFGALSKGVAKAGCWMKTGEGGLSKHHLSGGCDIVFQIGTAKYGVRDEGGKLSNQKLKEIAEIPQVKMFEIKLSQGAKPGKGGMLPAIKVTPEIAAVRGIPASEDSISPNRHVEIDNPGQLLDMIARIKKVTGKPVGFKLVIGGCNVLDNLFAEIQKRGIESSPDFISLDSSDGGTGAAPQALMDYMGLPISESLPMLVDHLVGYGLRDRVKVICSGKMITPSAVAWALCIGADFVVSARGFLFSLGCIQAMQCNKNTCPTGITTHNARLQRGLNPQDKSERVKHYVDGMLHDIAIIAHSCGVKAARDLQRRHARIIASDGKSISLASRFPEAIHGFPHGGGQS